MIPIFARQRALLVAGGVAAGLAIAAALLPHGADARAATLPATSQLLQRAFGAVSAGLQQDFAHARDWRAFVLQAVQQPGQGGLFYSRYVLEQCVRERGGQDVLVRSRCAAFAPGEAAHLMEAVDSAARATRDPLSEVAQRVASSTDDPEALRTGVEQMLLLADPLLLSRGDLLLRVSASDAEARALGGLYVDGGVVAPGSGRPYRVAQWALRLGACTEGLACALDEQVRAGCDSMMGCDLDRVAYVRSQLVRSGGSEEEVATVQALADRVRSAVSNQAVSFFVR